MESLSQKIEDLIDDLIALKDDDNFDASQIDDVIYELNNIQEVVDRVEED